MELNLLADLIASDTSGGDYQGILGVLSSYLSQHTCAKLTLQHVPDERTRSPKYNLIATFGQPKLLINCHLDTVPATRGWTKDPTTLDRQGNRLIGLGTADTKGNIAAVCEACATLEAQGAEGLEVMLLFSVDEEGGDGRTSGVRHFLTSPLATGIQQALVCEPTGLGFVTSHPGYYSFELKVSWNPCHSSVFLEPRENAITAVARLVLMLEKEGFHMGRIHGGVRGNSQPGSCSLRVSIRSSEPYHRISKRMDNACRRVPGAGYQPRFIGAPLAETGPTEVMGAWDMSSRSPAGFWTEAALFATAGIPAMVFGAGDIEQAHAPDEYVQREQLSSASTMFIRLLEATTTETVVGPARAEVGQ